MFEIKSVAALKQAEQLKAFQLTPEHSLRVAAIPKILNKPYINTIHHYTKEEVVFQNAGALHFIKKNKKITRVIWHAPEEKLQQALLFGLIPVEALTAKAIAALGDYRQQVVNRSFKKARHSNKHQQKIALVTIAQENIVALQPLERLINTFNEAVDLVSEKARIQQQVEATLVTLKAQSAALASNLMSLEAFDKGALKNMQTFYSAQMTMLARLKSEINDASVEKIKVLLQATGSNSLLTRIKTMSMSIILKTQELNQNLTYSRSARSWLRGSLNDACEEALKALRDYEVDPHNPILSEHQGNFATNLETNTDSIAVDFSAFLDDELKMKARLEALCFLSGQDNTLQSKTNSLFNVVKNLLVGVWNFTIGIAVGSVIDIPLGFLTGLLSFGYYKTPSLASVLTIRVVENQSASVAASYQHLSFKKNVAGALFGQKVGRSISGLIQDMSMALVKTVQNLKREGWDQLVADYKTGVRGGSYLQKTPQILESLAENLEVLKAKEAQQQQTLAALENKILSQVLIKTGEQNALPVVSNSSPRMAQVPYHLSSGEWNDLTNVLIDNIKQIVEEDLVHPIHAKHPFLGLLMTSLFTALGLVMMVPGQIPVLSKSYTMVANLFKKALAPLSKLPFTHNLQLFDDIQNASLALDLMQQKPEDEALDKTPLTAALMTVIESLPSLTLKGIEEILQERQSSAHVDKIAQVCTDNTLLKRNQLLFALLLFKHEDLLPQLNNTLKRELLLSARHLFKNTDRFESQIRALTALFYPSKRSSFLTNTMTLMTSYLPLIVRCLLSPVTLSVQPWRDLGGKINKDMTRLLHGMSKLVNFSVKIAVRIGIRGPADVLANEVVARFEGLIQNDHHRVSAVSYSVARCYEKSSELVRQGGSSFVDTLRASTTAPAGEIVLSRALQHAATPSVLGLFAQSRRQETVMGVAADHVAESNPTSNSENSLRS